MGKQTGFTLIELIAVIVILSILAVVAVPQFVDLRKSAADASAAGVGGAIASGTALNYAKGVAQGGASQVVGCDATQLGPLVGGSGSTATALSVSGRNYTIGGTAAGLASAQTRQCTITDAGGITGVTAQNFTIIGCATAGSC